MFSYEHVYNSFSSYAAGHQYLAIIGLSDMLIEDGHLELSDPDLIAEARSYTRDDLMEREVDPRLTTRHFDLLMAAAIAWQMRNYAKFTKENDVSNYKQPDYERSGLSED